MQVQVFWCIFLQWMANSYWRLEGFSAFIFRDDESYITEDWNLHL